MKNVFLVRWKHFWKSLTGYMWGATLMPLAGVLAFGYVTSGFDHSAVFEYAPPFALSMAVLAIVAFIPVFALLMSLYFRRASVTVSADAVQGMNYWGRRKFIPLQDIAAFSLFRSNGGNAIIVQSRNHGRIYISHHTERLEELVALLATSLPEPLQERLNAVAWKRPATVQAKAQG